VGLDIRLNQRLDLQLKLSPQIIQSIEMLQLPSLDLLEVIEKELDTNEFLERGRTAEAEAPAAPATTEPAAGPDYERMDVWDDPATRRPRSRDEHALNAKQEAMNNTAAGGPSLPDSLLEQYHLLDADPRLLPLAEQIIYNIDDQGYLRCSLEEAMAPLADRFDLADAEKALRLVQTLEPRGVGARTPAECLLLQLDPAHPDHELRRRLIEGHLEDIRKNRLPKVARDLGVDLDRLKELLHGLSGLSLSPGERRREERNHYIRPDIVVEWNGQDYDVRLANEYIPELRLNPAWREALASPDVPREYKEYVKRKVDSARAFILAVEKRQKTLLEVARRIVHYQRDFFDYGPHHLKPLKMQQIADDVGVHVSTISRATTEKYLQSHRGIHSLKDFFTSGTQAADGTLESRDSVMFKIKELVDREDKKSPLSDDQLVLALSRRHGIDVARRTVTKYRKALSIPSSRQRRQF
jgi:RNA polymerase sigma-54 factor